VGSVWDGVLMQEDNYEGVWEVTKQYNKKWKIHDVATVQLLFGRIKQGHFFKVSRVLSVTAIYVRCVVLL
jgi:hypothetical protein